MIQTLIQNWWLLALCGVLDAITSVIYFIMQGTDVPLTFHAWNGTIVWLGNLPWQREFAGSQPVFGGPRRANAGCWC